MKLTCNLEIEGFCPVDRHFRDLGVIMLLDFLKLASVTTSDEVDSYTLAPPTSTASDTMEVCMDTFWQVEVDYGAYLLYIDASCSNVRRDKNSSRSVSELLIAVAPLLFIHTTVDLCNWIVISRHSIIQILYTSNAIAVDDALCHA